jgi:hypothetical protein
MLADSVAARGLNHDGTPASRTGKMIAVVIANPIRAQASIQLLDSYCSLPPAPLRHRFLYACGGVHLRIKFKVVPTIAQDL